MNLKTFFITIVITVAILGAAITSVNSIINNYEELPDFEVDTKQLDKLDKYSEYSSTVNGNTSAIYSKYTSATSEEGAPTTSFFDRLRAASWTIYFSATGLVDITFEGVYNIAEDIGLSDQNKWVVTLIINLIIISVVFALIYMVFFSK